MIDDILLNAEDRMEKSIESLNFDLRTIRTGRATPALVEHIPVDYYGAPTPLNQLAVIGVPEPRLIVIRPFNPGDIGDIQKAILRSDLGITPSNDSKVIRLAIPQLTEERRKELVRQVGKRVEEARISIRNIRRDANEELKSAEKSKDIPEDDFYWGRDEIQELVDRMIEQIDGIGEAKEKEILEI
ncbi:MAG: ribosome recycling factor [Chloroflexota bacterium]|nr:ribosome recycling factor [Chloroflexota bacterium]